MENANYDVIPPEKLFIGAINNTGLVSVLLAGETGTGKTYTIEKVLEEQKIKRRSIPAMFAPDSVEAWQTLLGELVRKQVKVLVIDHIEDMPHKAQTALFHVFSNHYGELCRFPDSNFDLRMVFTTVKSINELRTNSEILMPHVYDRMSQLIIRFPQLMDLDNTWAKFKEVWKAMNFENFKDVPTNEELKKWINNNRAQMHGNFRDLEKIAIRWHNRRLIGVKEDKILNQIKGEYEKIKFGAEPEPESGNEKFIFPVPDGNAYTYKIIEESFRSQLIEWTIKEKGGNVSRAAIALGVSIRTLERWRSELKKVTN